MRFKRKKQSHVPSIPQKRFKDFIPQKRYEIKDFIPQKNSASRKDAANFTPIGVTSPSLQMYGSNTSLIGGLLIEER